MATRKKPKKTRQGQGKFSKWSTHKKTRQQRGKPWRGQGHKRR